jgi:hypothetical protein
MIIDLANQREAAPQLNNVTYTGTQKSQEPLESILDDVPFHMHTTMSHGYLPKLRERQNGA